MMRIRKANAAMIRKALTTTIPRGGRGVIPSRISSSNIRLLSHQHTTEFSSSNEEINTTTIQKNSANTSISTPSSTTAATPNNIITSSSSSSPISSSRQLSSLPNYPYYEEDDDDDEYENTHDTPFETTVPPSTATPPTISSSSTNDDEERKESPSHLCYTNEDRLPITSQCHIVTPQESMVGIWPVFRVMDEDGSFRNPKNDGYNSTIKPCSPSPHIYNNADETNTINTKNENDKHNLSKLKQTLLSQHPHHQTSIEQSNLFTTTASSSSPSSQNPKSYYLDPKAYEHQFFPIPLNTNTLLRAHRTMIRLRTMDTILQESQRQGRISFYLTCRGEEAIHVGSASALSLDDVILAQYREAGVLMWRGFTLQQFAHQCFGNDLDLGRGRQMPIHYGSKALNYHTISSPLGVQIPQAVGVAYRKKLDALNNPSAPKSVAIAYFGDGAASTTDFHSACNFAATLQTPVIFFCRNNGYAISTPTREQYAGDGIVSRAPGYGMASIRVDGNDLFAVHTATLAAKAYAIEHSAPVLIEAMTYRQGHHSTSDDSYQYRPSEEVLESERTSDPMKRLNAFLMEYGWLDGDGKDIAQIEKEERTTLLKAMEEAEKRPMPKLETMFQDVYHTMPPHLQHQERSLKEHLEKYSDKYE